MRENILNVVYIKFNDIEKKIESHLYVSNWKLIKIKNVLIWKN